MQNLSSKFKIGLVWSVFGQFGYMLVIFFSNIFLARLIAPEEFGVLAIAFFFIAISNVLVESGMGGALVREKSPTENDYSTIFIFNLGISIILYLILFVLSDTLREFYKIPNLGFYLKILGLVLIINAFKIIQNVRLIKALNFKKLYILNTVSVFISAIVGIILAIIGYGIWALIIIQVLNALFSTLLFWWFGQMITSFTFSRQSWKKLYNFGIFTTLSSMLNAIFDNIYQIILGKYFSLNQTGYFYQSKKLTEVPVGLVKSLTSGVVFSALSNIQDEKQEFQKFYSNLIRIFTVVVGLICLLIFLFAKEVLFLLYGKKWLNAELYLKIMSIAYFFYMQELFNKILFKIYNKTRKILFLEVVKKIILSLSIVFGIYMKSLDILLYGFMISYILSYYINYYYSRKFYISESTYLEMMYMHKTLGVTIFITILLKIIDIIFPLNFLYNFFYLPLIIILYLILLRFLKVIDIKRDLSYITNLNKT